VVGQLAQPHAHTRVDQRQALGVPGLVALQQHGVGALQDRRLDGVERGEHPGDGAGARGRRGRRVGQQAGTRLRQVQHDGARFEQRQLALLVGRDLPEGMQRAVRRRLHLGEGDQPHVVRLADFFQRPAHAHVARQAAAAVGRPGKGGEGGDRHATGSGRWRGR